jgi:hypothetical protein
MKGAFRLLLIAILTATITWAQTVATVTSTATFTLRGAQVNPAQGVPSFPVMPNDVIKAGSQPTSITFPDGSVIALAPNAEARIEVVDGKPLFRLISGEAQYKLKTLGAVILFNGNTAITPTQLSAVLAATKVSAGFWTPLTTGLVLGATGAAAGLGVGLTQALQGGAPPSPSQP